LVGIELVQHYLTGMLFLDQQNMLIQEHVLLGKISVTREGHGFIILFKALIKHVSCLRQLGLCTY